MPFDIAFSLSDHERWHFSYALRMLDQDGYRHLKSLYEGPLTATGRDAAEPAAGTLIRAKFPWEGR